MIKYVSFQSPQRNRESVNVPTSPVGGEFYPAQSRRSRSPSSERLLPKSPVRGQENASLIRAALKDYFEKYGMWRIIWIDVEMLSVVVSCKYKCTFSKIPWKILTCKYILTFDGIRGFQILGAGNARDLRKLAFKAFRIISYLWWLLKSDKSHRWTMNG